MAQRKENSLFDQVCKFVNSLSIGTVFKNAQLYDNCDEKNTRWKNGDRYITRNYRRLLVIANCLKHDSRGKWQVIAHVPDFVTLNMLEANRGYRRYVQGMNWSEMPLRGKKWKAGESDPNLSIETITSDTLPVAPKNGFITLYSIKNESVEPFAVLNGVHYSYLSTGNYFETEDEALEFLAISKNTSVDILKATSKFKEDIKEYVENNTIEKMEVSNLSLDLTGINEVENPKIIIDDLRRKDVFFTESGIIFKGIIKHFEVICNFDDLKITNIIVALISSSDSLTKINEGKTEFFENLTGLYFTKEELLEELKETIDSL